MSLDQRTIIITGIANQRSIAFGIAKTCVEAGARVILTYQNDKLKERVQECADNLGIQALICCDTTKEQDLAQLKESLLAYKKIDGLVHAIAYAPREALEGSFTENTSLEAFQMAHEVSSHSLLALCQTLKGQWATDASIVSLTHHASSQVFPNYNVMGLAKASLEASIRYLAADLGPQGIRVNGISAGPVRTLAASGIKSFKQMLHTAQEKAPLKRGVTLEEIGQTAQFLLSTKASGITGQIIYVDAGLSIMGQF
jgi:enoyl-[acyl-carrier protein] reductase I